MNKAHPNFIATTARRPMPGTDRWQTHQAQLSRNTGTLSHPWTRCSAIACDGRGSPARVSAARA